MDRSNLASQLHEWSYKEMHFRPKGQYVDCKPPGVEDFQELCRGPTGAALKYLVDHIYSSQNVHKVKGNIKLHDSQLSRGRGRSLAPKRSAGDDGEHAVLLEKHKDLSYQLTNNLTAVGHVEKDLSRVRRELQNTEQSYREALTQIENLQKKTALLKSHSLSVQSTEATLNECRDRIRAKTDFLQNRAQKNEGNTVLAETTKDASQENGFETVCTKAVRETSHDIASFLQEMLQGKFGDNADLMSKKKEVLWRRVESVVAQHPPRQVLLSLNALAHHFTGSLREKTARINIQKDAQELRFKYEKGNLQDISNPPTVLQTVGQLLEFCQYWKGDIDFYHYVAARRFQGDSSKTFSGRQVQYKVLEACVEIPNEIYRVCDISLEFFTTDIYILASVEKQAHSANFERFVQTEKSKNNTWGLQERLEKAKEPVIAHLERSYRGDPGALELAKNLLQTEIQVAASRANLRELQNSSEFLKERISLALAEKEMLFSKYQKIQSFQKLTESKQNLIQVLIKQNMNAKDRLQSQQQQIQKYVERAMSVHDPETKSYCAELENCVTAEVEAFSGTSLPYLVFTMLDSSWKVSVLDLSINRFRGGQENSTAVHTLWTIMDTLDCPAFKAPECLLRSIVELKRQQEELDALQRHNLYNRDTEYKTVVENMAVLAKEVERSDGEQMEKLLPSLQKHLAQSTQALTHCLDVKDTAQLWWEQPAQNCVPWVKVDDLSFQQWHDKWTVLVTRLRQVLVQKGEKSDNLHH